MAASLAPLHWVEEAARFARALPAWLPAALFSALLLEWLLPALAGEARLFVWPFALALGNAWLLGAIARAQGLTAQGGAAFGWQRLGDLLLCAACYWLLTAAWLLAAVAGLRLALGRSLQGVELDPSADHGFLLALLLLGYLLLRMTSACLGPFLDERSGRWPRCPGALLHGWRLSRGQSAHRHAVLPMAIGALLLVGLQQARDLLLAPQGLDWFAALLWHGLAWPAFSWLCLERCAALAAAHPEPASQRSSDASGATTAQAPTAANRTELPMRQSERNHYYSPDWSPQTVFVSAAVNGDVATLQRLLAEGMPADTLDHEGVSAALRAANAEQPQAVSCLLRAGASVSARDRGGRSLLHLLTAYPATLHLLDEVLARGVSVDDQFEGGVTPLMTALLRGHVEGARALLARGADPCLRDAEGNTCVMHMIGGIYAFRSGHDHSLSLALLRDLLALGVDVNASDRRGRTALSLAAGKGLGDVVALLQQHGASVQRADRDGLTPLQQAWSGEHAELLDQLLAQRVPIDFHSAVALGRETETDRYLESDPTLLERELSALRAGPLALAIRYRQPAMVRRLLAGGADPNGRAPQAGMLACAVRHLPDPAILRLLIEHGAELDAADGDGNTALNFAARDDQLQLARILLEAGADPNARTERGYTVLCFARSDAMRELLRAHGGIK
jgi:ankyrin repeat protein